MTIHDSPSLRVFAGLTMAVFVAVALLPAAVVLFSSVWIDGCLSTKAFASVLTETRQWELLRNTCAIAIGTALLATVLGAPLGLLLEYGRVRSRRWVAYGIGLPLLIPPYIHAIVWVDALGRKGILRFGLDTVQAPGAGGFLLYSTLGAVMVLGLSYFPIVTLVTAAALRRYDPHIEDPALLVAKRLILFRCITLPLLAPSIASGFLFVFLLALVEFAVPSLLQVNVYAVEIFGRFSASYDSAEAAAQALPLLMGGAAIVAGWALWIRPRQGRLPGRASGSALRPSAGWGWRVGVAWSWVLVSGASFLPLGLLFRQSLPLSSYREVWQTAHDEIASSLLLAALSATALTVLALAMAYLSRTRSITARAYLSSLLPFLVSGPLLGIGFILVWNRPGMPSWIYDTPAVLVLACVARLLFFAYLALRAALHDLPPRLEEAASVLGVPWWRQVFGILIPLASPVIVGVWGLGFVFSLRELDTAVLVAPPGWTPLSVRLFGLMHYGPSRFVAALSVVTAAIILLAAILTTVVYSTARRVIDARR